MSQVSGDGLVDAVHDLVDDGASAASVVASVAFGVVGVQQSDAALVCAGVADRALKKD